MHNIWIKSVSGRLRMDLNYSSDMCYNNYPIPSLTKSLKEALNQSAFQILEEREKHTEKTLAELYNPDKMPVGLKEVHHKNDILVERCYRKTPFTNDSERLDYLFSLYEKMVALEQSQDTLFADEVVKKRKRRINA